MAGRDKISAGTFLTDLLLTPEMLSGIYYGDVLAAKIVDKHVTESFRKGYTLHADDVEDAKDFQKYAQRLDVNTKVSQALKWGRLFGGALLIIGAQDGSTDLSQPLNEKRVGSIPWLIVVDKRNAIPQKYYDKLGPKFGEPETYMITAQGNATGLSFVVHESRCIRFGAVEVDAQRGRQLHGWDQSVLQRPYEVLRMFATALQGVGISLADSNQGIFKIKGLIESLSTNQAESIKERLQMLDYGRSNARSAVLDATEDFSKVASSFSGTPELVDRFMQWVAAAADMPVSILFGRSAAGMNATGDLDLDSWHASVASYQTNDINPKLIRLLEILQLSKDSPTRGQLLPGWSDESVQWKPLRVPSAKEAAEVRKLHAETMALYVTMQAFDPAQVAIAVAGRGGGEWSDAAPEINVAALESEMEARATFEDPNEPEIVVAELVTEPDAEPQA